MQLAKLCTEQQLDPIHILDVIHDFMNTDAEAADVPPAEPQDNPQALHK